MYSGPSTTDEKVRHMGARELLESMGTLPVQVSSWKTMQCYILDEIVFAICYELKIMKVELTLEISNTSSNAGKSELFPATGLPSIFCLNFIF